MHVTVLAPSGLPRGLIQMGDQTTVRLAEEAVAGVAGTAASMSVGMASL